MIALPRASVLLIVVLPVAPVGCDLSGRGSPPRAGPTVAAPSAHEPALRAHADDIADYTLDATLDPVAHTVHAEGTVRWRNKSTRPVREIWVHLYLNAFKNERSAFLRERVGGRGSGPVKDWGWIDVRRLVWADGADRVDLLPAIELSRAGDEDETDARVPLPRSVMPGESMNLEVVFDDKLPALVERTGYRDTFHFVGQWFPKIARLEPDGTWAHFPFHHLSEFYGDFGTYDVTLDVPSAFTLGATGPVIESHVDHGRRVERHVQSDVHDFAWTAWDRWQSLDDRVDGVDVRVLFPPGFDGVARRDLEAVRFALPYDSARYGHYPYSVLTVVHPQQDASEAGGMEYPTLITADGAALTPRGVYVPEIVAVHELGHQWFYGLVATNEAAWPFLDEGVNQYAEADAMSKWRGAGSAVDFWGIRVSDEAIQAQWGSRGVHDEPIAQPAAEFSTGSNYGRLVYARTATVLETLARVYGQDAVDTALGEYARRFRFEHPAPDDLLAAFRVVLGDRVAATLRTALFDRGWVDFTVDDIWTRRAETPAGVFDRAGRRETVTRENQGRWVGSVLVRRRGTLSFPVDVDLVLDDGSTRREHWDGVDDSVRFPWEGPTPLRAVVVDPDDRVLLDANPLNNRGMVPGERTHAWRTLERILYWAELAQQLIFP
ncbi:MAG: M1 family metallopeptidase [Polyangiaceae bacterium]|jgi:hypothetical protein